MPKSPNPAAGDLPSVVTQICRSALELSPQPMLAVEGRTHVVRFANPAFCRLAGTDASQLIGRPFSVAVREGTANQCAAMLDRVFATGLPEALGEQEHASDNWAGTPTKESSPSYWSYLAWAMLGPASNPIGVMIQVTETTENARFRQGAAAINEALLESGIKQHELTSDAQKLTEELRESEAHERTSRQEAQSADRTKDVFLALLSHELRTPLNAILGWSVILRTSGKPMDNLVSEGLEVIERNARVQAKLIEDVLDVARITSGKFMLDTRPLDLTGLVLSAVDAVRPSADARVITLRVSGKTGRPGKLWILGDAFRLQQAITNLLTNAIKFTPMGGLVTVRVERVETSDGDKARVTVTDTGEGIAAEFLPSIFERFKQAGEGTTRSFGGLGLGLSIVRHIAEAHGGTARAGSEGEGRGATFTLELRAPSESAELLHANMPSSVARLPRLDGVRVLVVDDELDSRTTAHRALDSAGATVVLAVSAEAGYQLATERDPDRVPHVLVSDIGMPGEDGYSMMRRVRAEKAGREMPAVAVSAFAAPEDKRRALLAGFQVHLAKPVDPRDLIAVVAGLVGRTVV